MKKYILDACALIAVLNKEQGAESVKNLLEHDGIDIEIYMSIVNLLEVYYGLLREYGKATADSVLLSIKSSPINIINTISESVFLEAGRFKSAYKISLADSFVLAEGNARKLIVISSDHHEFDIVEQNEDIEFL